MWCCVGRLVNITNRAVGVGEVESVGLPFDRPESPGVVVAAVEREPVCEIVALGGVVIIELAGGALAVDSHGLELHAGSVEDGVHGPVAAGVVKLALADIVEIEVALRKLGGAFKRVVNTAGGRTAAG